MICIGMIATGDHLDLNSLRDAPPSPSPKARCVAVAPLGRHGGVMTPPYEA